jgi:hypothetical protein
VPLEEDLEHAMVVSKLEATVAEYSHLLVSQLDSQRMYFETRESLLQNAVADAESRLAEASIAAEKSQAMAAAAHAVVKETERRKKDVERKLVSMCSR